MAINFTTQNLCFLQNAIAKLQVKVKEQGVPPRNEPREPLRGYPAVGAVHPIIATEHLRSMLFKVADIADDVLDPQLPGDLRSMEEKIADGEFYDPADYYRLYDAQTLGISVLEMDISARIAALTRTVWQKNDLGDVKQRIIHEAERRMPDELPIVVANGVLPVGGRMPMAPNEKIRAKLAFIFDPTRFDHTQELLFEEHDLVKRAVERRLNKKRRHYEPMPIVDFIPHATFLAYKAKTSHAAISEINRQIDLELKKKPLLLPLGRLTTDRSHLVR